MTPKSILSHFVSIGTGTVLNIVIGFITTPILTRLVGTAEYGQYSIFTMYGSIMVLILCMGFDQALIRYFYKHDTKEYQKKILRECCYLPIICSLLVVIIFNCMSWFGVVKFEFESKIITMLTITVFFQVLNRIDLILLRVSYNTKLYSLLQVLNKVLFAIAAIVGCISKENDKLFVLAGASAFAYSIVTIVGVWKQKDLWSVSRVKCSYEINRKEIRRYAFPFVLSMGLTSIFQAIDKISLNKYCTYEEVGVYSSAITLVHVFAIIQTTFGAIWAPMAIEHYEKNPKDKIFYLKAFRLMSFLMFVLGAFLILFKDIFVLLLGEDYRNAARLIPFLSLSPIMLTISDITMVGINFNKKSYVQIIVSAIACGANIIGNILLVPIYGCIGAALSTGFSYIVFFIARTAISNKFYQIKWGLHKLGLVLILFLVFAFGNTFFSSNIFSIICFALIVIVMCVCYRDEIKYVWISLRKLRSINEKRQL